MSRLSSRVGFSRRTLLKSLGAGAALAPFLPLLNASGQELVFPKRLLLFYCPDGTASIDDGGAALDWKPSGSEQAFTLGSIHAPLQAQASKIIVPFGLKLSAGGAGQEHAFGMAGLWTAASLRGPSADADFDGGNGNRTGWGSGPSIDQLVAQAVGSDTPYARAAGDAMQETPYRTLELGVQCLQPDSKHRMIYKGDNEPIHPETNPQAAFNRLFGSLVDTEPAPAGSDASLGRRAQLDLLMKQVERLRTQVGREEYVKIEAHLSGLQALERRLDTTPTASGAACMAPALPEANSQSTRENSATFPAEVSAMIDIVTQAFACDLTRVASLQLSRGFSNIVHSWAGANQGHHTVSHLKSDERALLGAIDTWYATQFAALLTALDSVKEGNGTLLDNTLVVWGREMGQTNHRMAPAPLMLAGSGRGRVVPGRFLAFNNEPHAKLLVTVCQAMGLDVDSVGDIAPDSGPLAGIL